MYSPDTPRSHYLKLMEDSLRSRVDEAREMLLIAKQNFVRACLMEDSDPELHREREIIAARMQTRALENLLTAVINFNAFILGETVPNHLPPQSTKLQVPRCRICGAEASKEFGTELLCDKCENNLHIVPLRRKPCAAETAAGAFKQKAG